ncbi:hypothetical protein SAMN05444370_10974 [Rubrimonas cliftonensis]|uniref:Uncharacterized protein n=1 Tax=Rubrimonas cliftonensis TaxID=89524 RepID=A0A1H4D6I0_9RHOB|nr:hypothetical protein SAMN05444370_10974 [Rubrimonas cliftonensis]
MLRGWPVQRSMAVRLNLGAENGRRRGDGSEASRRLRAFARVRRGCEAAGRLKLAFSGCGRHRRNPSRRGGARLIERRRVVVRVMDGAPMKRATKALAGRSQGAIGGLGRSTRPRFITSGMSPPVMAPIRSWATCVAVALGQRCGRVISARISLPSRASRFESVASKTKAAGARMISLPCRRRDAPAHRAGGSSENLVAHGAVSHAAEGRLETRLSLRPLHRATRRISAAPSAVTRFMGAMRIRTSAVWRWASPNLRGARRPLRAESRPPDRFPGAMRGGPRHLPVQPDRRRERLRRASAAPAR